MLLLLWCAALSACLVGGTPPRVPSSIFPLPLSQTQWGATALPLCAGFSFVCAPPCAAPLPSALERYKKMIFFWRGTPRACRLSLPVLASGLCCCGGAAKPRCQ